MRLLITLALLALAQGQDDSGLVGETLYQIRQCSGNSWGEAEVVAAGLDDVAHPTKGWILQGFLAHPKSVSELHGIWSQVWTGTGAIYAWVGATDEGTENIWRWSGGTLAEDGALMGSLQNYQDQAPAGLFIKRNNRPIPANCGSVKLPAKPATDAVIGLYDVSCEAGGGSENIVTHCLVQFDDLKPPVITRCPSDITVEMNATLAVPAIPRWDGDATDNVAVTGEIPSITRAIGGPAYPQQWIVTYLIHDANFNSAQCSRRITVVDNLPPVVTCPPNRSFQQGSAPTTPFTATAYDQGDGVVPATCTPNGAPSTFAVGDTNITCTATDSRGLVGSCKFKVSITSGSSGGGGAMLPGTCNSVVAEATSPAPGLTVVDFQEPQFTGVDRIYSDPVDLPLQFPVGVTIITWTTDATGGGPGPTCSITVTVRDTTKPEITCPPPISVNADEGKSTATVDIPVLAKDFGVACQCGVTCTPAGPYASGTTTVTCKATDAAGNTATCQTSVTVNGRVLIDVRPGKCPNLVKYPVSSMIPVAILGSSTFDVNTIVRSSLKLDGVAADPNGMSVGDYSGPWDPKSWWAKRFAELRCGFKSHDGIKDLKAYWNQTAIANIHRIWRGWAIAWVTITGQTTSGRVFSGQDIVVITGYQHPPKPRPGPRWPDHRDDDDDDDDDDDCDYNRYRKTRKED